MKRASNSYVNICTCIRNNVSRQLEKTIGSLLSIVRPLMESHHISKNNIRALILIENDQLFFSAEGSVAISRENKSVWLCSIAYLLMLKGHSFNPKEYTMRFNILLKEV